MEQAVQQCEPNVAKLGEIGDKLKEVFDQSGKRRATWASMKSVVRKNDVDGYRCQIQEDMMALNSAMLVGSYNLM